MIAAPGLAYLAGAGLQIALRDAPDAEGPLWGLLLVITLLGVPVAIGVLLHIRAPDTPVGAAMAWVGAAPALVLALESWGSTESSARPWLGAQFFSVLGAGIWVWNVAGFAALCLVFPDGRLPGRRWRVIAWSSLAVGVFVNASTSLVGEADQDPVIAVGGPGLAVVIVATFVACLAALGATVASLIVRYRGGEEKQRQQLRWLLLGAGTVPILLAAGWFLQYLEAPPSVAYIGLFLAMLVVVPAAVAVAVLRYDLFDVDRLIGSTLSWFLTTGLSAAVFAGVVLIGGRLGAGSHVGVTGAAFLTALLLVPLHRKLTGAVARIVDRDRYAVATLVQRFVQQVRDGTAQPEEAESVFRQALGDPKLRLLLRVPGGGPTDYVDATGAPATPEPGAGQVDLRSGPSEVGLVILSDVSARRRRLAREVAHAARLPIEVSRLRLELRAALTDVQSSRARLVRASAEERRRLERNLHDGAQQQIVAVGMRLRSVQRDLEPGSRAHRDLDAAVAALEGTVAELRRLANGVRPSRLDDGLSAAIHTLVADSPIPVRLTVADIALPDVVATTVYFMVAEAYANALKHAHATALRVELASTGSGLTITVADNGLGGASPELTAVRDRVVSIDGTLTVDSPAGQGTRVRVEIPDAHRRR